jgi:SAM-dependent methyltransferase
MRAVAQVRQLCGTVRFVAGSAEHIPLDDCSSDIVFMSQVFHHLADKALALREIRRILVPSGRFVLRQTTLENLDSYFYQRFFPEARRLDEQRLSSRAEVLGIANDCGYRLVGFDCSPFSIAATPAEYLEKIALRTFSDLEYISDEAFHRGLDAIRRYGADHPDFPKTDERDLFAFVRP